jgi:cytochrome c553
MKVSVRKFFKWMGLVVGIALSLALAWVYFASERELGRQYAVETEAAPNVSSDMVAVNGGHRIAALAGCTHCHGEKMAGALVDDVPNLVRLVASNASVLLPNYSDAQLATLLRKGVKPDGTGAMFMPSEMFRHLDDQDLASLIAWLRTVPVTRDGVQEKTQVRIVGRVLLATGMIQAGAHAIETLPRASHEFDANDPVSRGRYLTMSFCSECHGQQLEGFEPIHAPPLTVAKGYSLDQFARLMHDGVPLGDRELRIMGPTSRARFANFTSDEIVAVHAFLQSRS